MNPIHIFYLLITIIIADYLVHAVLDSLNAKHYQDEIPEELKDVYDEAAYQKSMEYNQTNYQFKKITAFTTTFITLAFISLNGFTLVDDFARSITSNPILVGLIFFGIMAFGSDLINIPFSYYQNFVIEEAFGFNKMTLKTFILDKLKSWGMMILVGGSIMSLIIWFYELTTTNFWLYTWAVIALFVFFTNMFYTKLIVPMFNDQKPLEAGSLRDKIEAYVSTVGFTLKKHIRY